MARKKVRCGEVFKYGDYVKTVIDEGKVTEIWYYNRRYFKIFKRGRLTTCQLLENYREYCKYKDLGYETSRFNFFVSGVIIY